VMRGVDIRGFRRRFRASRPGAVLLLTVAACAPSAAQDAVPPVLPDLAPRDVEIRGQLEISFPSLQRQPLIGFNPPPRVPEIPPSRRPVMEDYAHAGTAVDRTLLEAPVPPAVARLGNRTPLSGEAELSTGRYLARRIHAKAIAPLPEGHDLRGIVDYVGSNGLEVAREPETVKNPADDFSARVDYGRTWSAVAIGAWVEGYADAYNLYGIVPGESSLVAPAPDRKAGSFGGGFRLSAGPNSVIDFEVELGASGENVDTELYPGGQIEDPTSDISESRGFLTASLGVPSGPGDLIIDVAGQTAGVDDSGFLGTSVQQGEASVGYRFRTARFRLHVGGRVLTTSFEGEVGGMPTDDRRSAVYLSPDIDLRFALSRAIELFAANSPAVIANSLGDLFAANPFLVSAPAMQPSISTVDGRAGANISTRDLRASAWLHYQRSPNMLYFANSTGSGAGRVEFGYFNALYAEASIFGIGGEVGWSMRSGVQFSLGGKLNRSDLSDEDSRIPYVPSFEGWIGASIPFLDTRGLFQATGRYVGKRYADVEEDAEVDPFLGVDLYAHYNVLRNVGIVARLDNLSPGGLDILWDGYPQRTNVFMLGVRLLW